VRLVEVSGLPKLVGYLKDEINELETNSEKRKVRNLNEMKSG
jgi:hypothetical protein